MSITNRGNITYQAPEIIDGPDRVNVGGRVWSPVSGLLRRPEVISEVIEAGLASYPEAKIVEPTLPKPELSELAQPEAA